MMDEDGWSSFLEHECWNRKHIDEALFCYGQLEYIVKRFVYEVRSSIGEYLKLETSGCPYSDPDVQPVFKVDGGFSFFVTSCKFMYSEVKVDLWVTVDNLLAGPEAFFQKWKEDEGAEAAERSVERERDLHEYGRLKRKWGFE